MKNTVSVAWVKHRLGTTRFKVLDARTRASFVRAHIPGALNADFFHYLVPGTDGPGLKQFNLDLSSMLGKLGLEGNEDFVVYEQGFGMRAARMAWMLQYAGMKKVALLEGGFRAWRKTRYRVQSGPVHLSAKAFRLQPDMRILATTASISSGSSRNRVVLDVRSEAEFEGSEKRDCCARPGRIPGAVWLEWTRFLQDGQKFLRGSSVMSLLERVGVEPGKEVVTYCHRGARAASAFYALKALGFRRVKNYVGSWHEWSSRPELPAEIGSVAKL